MRHICLKNKIFTISSENQNLKKLVSSMIAAKMAVLVVSEAKSALLL